MYVRTDKPTKLFRKERNSIKPWKETGQFFHLSHLKQTGHIFIVAVAFTSVVKSSSCKMEKTLN